MANGGYTILDFLNKPFTIGTAQKIDGIYNQIKNNYSKPIILWNLTIGTDAKKAMFLNFDLVNNNYTAQNGDLIFTISSNDNVLISNPEPEIITIEDVVPVVDCGGQSFGQLINKTVAGSYDKVKNGGPAIIKNFQIDTELMNYRVSDGGFLVNFGFQSTLAKPGAIEAIYYHINQTGTNTFKLYKYYICISRADIVTIWPFNAEDL